MAMDWMVFCKDTLSGDVVAGCFGKGRDITYLDWLFSAWGWTVSVSLTALVVALVVGSLIGVIRTLPNSPWLVRLGNAWVELFRNIPLLVQIFLWYFVLPALVPPMKNFPPFILVVLALGLFTSARIAEQVRAGILALPKGQRYAGMAVGFTTPQYYRYVLLHHHPAADQRVDEHLQEFGRGFRRVHPRADAVRAAGGRGNRTPDRGVPGCHGALRHLGAGDQPHLCLDREARARAGFCCRRYRCGRPLT